MLAKKGLNVVLISRNADKLYRVMKEIEREHGVKVKVIVADFTQQDIYDGIKATLSELDVGILINNVGIVLGFSLPHQVDTM